MRFLFGFPFAVAFLWIMTRITGDAIPAISLGLLPTVAVAALAQIGATGLMLASMQSKSFVVATAYTKTEPVLVALFGLVFLGDHLSLGMAGAIGIATLGVLLTAWPKNGSGGWSLPALALGITSAALFAVSAVAFRAAIHALPSGSFGIRASTILALGLAFQSVSLSLYLALTNRAALVAILKLWRPSLVAGFMGAFASQFWFLGFALVPAAKVRTLALIEVFFARVISGKMFSEKPTPREGLGLILIVIGVGVLLNL